jgi:phosphatidylglycerophosphate synthase
MTNVFDIVLAAAGAATLLSMLAYFALGRPRDADAEARGAHFLHGAGDFLVHWFAWLASPVGAVAARLGLGPGVFNFAGLGLGLLAGLLLAFDRLELGGWALVLAGAADFLDGRIARLRRAASAYGRFIDGTFDRFVETFVFLGCAVHLRESGLGVFLAAAALGGSLQVSYTASRGETFGVPTPRAQLQRAERLVLACLGCLLDRSAGGRLGWPPDTLLMAALGLVAVLSLATSTWRSLAISRKLRATGASSSH